MGKKRYCFIVSLTVLPWSCLIILYSIIRTPTGHTFKNNTWSGPGSESFSRTAPTVNGSESSVSRLIWMLWDRGWAKAPPVQYMCLHAVRRQNPDFKVRAINISEAENLINRTQHYSNKAWAAASIQAKSDIIRVELLSAYGGIWVDATVYCNEPFSNWLSELGIGGGGRELFAYERKDKEVNEINSPWISSWFLVAAEESNMMRIWRNEVRLAWSKVPTPFERFGYFWLHRLFAQLTKTNPGFKTGYANMKVLDAAGPHCLMDYKKKIPHVFKLNSADCMGVTRELLRLSKNKHRAL